MTDSAAGTKMSACDCGDWGNLCGTTARMAVPLGFVEGQRYVAVAAMKDVFAGGAEDEVAVAAAVQKQNCLLAPCQCFAELI